MKKQEENLVLALYDAKQLINYLATEGGFDFDKEEGCKKIEEDIDKILGEYSIMKFSLDNYTLIKKKFTDEQFKKYLDNLKKTDPVGAEADSIGFVPLPISTMPSFILHKVFKDGQRHRYTIDEFVEYALKQTGWNKDDCEYDYHYIHISDKLIKQQEENWKLLDKDLPENQKLVYEGEGVYRAIDLNLLPK